MDGSIFTPALSALTKGWSSRADAPSDRDGGLTIARALLDELGYERDGRLNRWRLMKRL